MIKHFQEEQKERYLKRAADRELAMTIVTVGDDVASAIYVRNKLRLLEQANVKVTHKHFSDSCTQEELNSYVAALNEPTLIQLPLPPHLECPELPAHLDVDGFGSEAFGLLMQGRPLVLPCTVQACVDLIAEHRPESGFRGLQVLVIGRSNIVGKPLVVELINRGAFVTNVNSAVDDLHKYDLSDFDVIVSATGSHGVIKASQFQAGQLVLDVGIVRTEDGIVGDVEHDMKRLSGAYITPVPGGVGPLTVLNVLGNLLELSE